jgi:hypothetical protein
MPADGYVMTFPPLSWVGNHAVATGDLVADIFAPSESGPSRRAA